MATCLVLRQAQDDGGGGRHRCAARNGHRTADSSIYLRPSFNRINAIKAAFLGDFPDTAKVAADARAKAKEESDKVLKVERAQGNKMEQAKEAQQKADQKAAAARIAATTNTAPDSGISIANPKDYVDGDILGRPK